MKKKLLNGAVLILCLISLAGVIGLIIRDMMRTPEEYLTLAREQMKEKKYQAASLLLKRAARGHLPAADYELALLYDVGDKIPENRKLAVEHMKKAAEAGLPEAQYALAVWMDRGYTGTRNPEEILRLYEQAATQGHKQAMTGLVMLYGGSVEGIPSNREKQAYWIQKLSQKGK